MFYLGGLTLGYLTPHSAVPDTTPAFSICQPKSTEQKPAVSPFGENDEGHKDDDGMQPLVWPWHLFC